MSNPSHYEVLGLNCSASSEEIRVAVIKLLKIWHPDVCHKPEAKQKTQRILEAKSVLLDPKLKAEYDASKSHESYRSNGSSDGQQYSRYQSWKAASSEEAAGSKYSGPSTGDYIGQAANAKVQANQEAEMSLDELLGGLGYYFWTGKARRDSASSVDFSSLLKSGVAGWFFVICLIIPGVSIFTWLWLIMALFSGKGDRFSGIGNTLIGMMIVGAVILLIGFILISPFLG